MSTLVAQTISNGTVSTSSTNVIQGCAKAFVSFFSNSGGAATIQKSYNVSSCTKAAAGTWYINYTNALSSVNCVVGSTGGAGAAPPNAQTTNTNTNLRCLVVIANNSTGISVASPYVNGAIIDDTFGVYNVAIL